MQLCVSFFPIGRVFSLFPAATFKRSRLPPINQGLYSRIGVYFLHRTTHRLGSITLQPSYVSALLRRFNRRWLILSGSRAILVYIRGTKGQERGQGTKKRKKSKRVRRRGRKKKKSLSRYIFRAIISLRVYHIRAVSGSAMSTAIRTIPSFSRLFATAAFHSFIRNFCIWRIGDYYHSISFARLRLHLIISSMCLSRFTYGHGHRLELRIYIYIILLLLFFHFLSFLSFIFRFPLPLFFSLLSLFVFSCVCDVCQSPDDVFSSTASIIVLHVFAIAKSITCHKCAVAAHFEEWCEASYTLIMVEHDCALRTGRDNTEKETEEQRMNFSDQLYLLLIFV